MKSTSRHSDFAKFSSDILKWIAAGFLLLGALVAILASVTMLQSRSQYEERAIIVTQNLAQVLEQNISSSIVRIDLGIQTIAHEAERQLANGRINGNSLDNFIAWQYSQHTDVDNMRVTDHHGNILYGTDIPQGDTASIADRDYFQLARANPNSGLLISKPVSGRISGKQIVVFARRINQPDGTFAGIAFAAVELAHIQKMFASLNLGPNGVVSLREQDMSILVRFPPAPPDCDEVGLSAVSQQFLDKSQTHPQAGSYSASSGVDKIKRILSYRLIPNYPAYIFVGLGEDDYLAEWWKKTLETVALVGLFVLTSLLASWFIFRAWKRQQAAISALREREGYQNALLNNFPFSVWLKDYEGRFLAVNQRFAETFGQPSAESLIGKTDFDIEQIERAQRHQDQDQQVLASGKSFSTEESVKQDGKRCWFEIYKSPILVNQQALGTVGFLRDITERKNLEEQIRLLAFYDPLTNLANRRLFQDRLNQAIAGCKRMENRGALMFLDLDNFKPINDTHGHEIGDLLLIEVAERLKDCVREMDTVARFGGDEFVVMICELSSDGPTAQTQAMQVAEKILRRLSEAYQLRPAQGNLLITHHCTASIGVDLFNGDETCRDDILKWADAGMYQAKESGRNTIRLFVPPLHG